MTTLDQVPAGVTPPQKDGSSPLDKALARVYTINWEVALYAIILVIAIFTRFTNLGDRVMSHDESLHTKYSHELYTRGIFQHTPLMHGPVLFHMTALSYFMFGDSDFSARIYPAVLGIIMVLMPKLLFERWLGKFGALVASVLILISPMLLYHHRYIREDTPAIFFTILMVYAMFAYVDGARPKQPRFLILFSGAMLLNLASKETAFMYVLIFALFAGLIVLFQMIQGWLRGQVSKIVGWTVLGTALVPLMGIAATLILNALGLRDRLPDFITIGDGQIQRETLLFISTILLGVPMALVLCGAAALVYVVAFEVVLRRPLPGLLHSVGIRGDSLLRIGLVGLLVGVVAALVLTNFLSIITPEGIRRSGELWAEYNNNPALPIPLEMDPNAQIFRLILWISALVLSLTLAVLGTAALRFFRMPRLPWADVLWIALIAVVVCLLLIFVEERSRLVPNVSSEVRTATTIDNKWIYGSWVVGILAVAGIAALRLRTTFWQEMRRYPMFDIVILMGSLILPWSAALPIFLAGYALDSSYTDPNLISACIAGVLPFALVSIAAGLAWRPTIWAISTATFYALFAFFYTTIFTNPTGVATGVVGSLGYWLAQQGVRRGSQPQYYYMLIQLPIYEFLPVIGSALAGIAGLASFWKFRAQRFQATADAEQVLAAESVSKDEPLASMAESDDKAKVPPTPATLPDEDAVVDLDALAPEIPPDYGDFNLGLEPEKRKRRAFEGAGTIGTVVNIPDVEIVERPHFITFVGYWSVLILMALTLSGEKMPWLTTHITLPMCLLTGWYVGTLLEKVNWETFFKQTWTLILLIPVFVVGAINSVAPFVVSPEGLGGLLRLDQMSTLTWIGAVLLTGLVGYAIWRVWRVSGTPQVLRVGALGVFTLLAVLTARAAWRAAYINYDYPTEFLVYAHSAPSNKWVMDYLDEISRRTTDGMNIKVAYDNLVSWPGSWYFRNYPGARYIGEANGVTGLEEYTALVLGDANARKIESQLGDKFFKYEFLRLWWPMQDYFNLNLARVDTNLGDPEMRQALWEIWLNRDYTRYTTANARLTGDQNTKFTVDKWPVADRMVFYVRKDVAAQVWDFGVGSAKVAGLPEDPFAQKRCDTCSAEMILRNSDYAMLNPRDVAAGPNGDIYVMDSQNARVVVFNQFGVVQRTFGSVSITTDASPLPAIGTFREPWGIAIDKEGLVYVADTWNHRVQVFSSTGEPIRTWGTFGRVDPGVPTSATVPDSFYGPRDIAVDDKGRVYVADTGNKRVRVYTTDGQFQYDIGNEGTQAGQMYEPVGLTINNRTEELFVANTWNKRIDVFTLGGMHLRSWTIQGWYATTPTSDSGNRPYITLDDTGMYLMVTDPDAGRVLVYDTLGNPVLTFGRLGVAPFETGSEFGALGGLTITPDGKLYLVDAAGARVLRFNLTALPGLARTINPPAESSPIEPTSATPKDF